VWFNGHLLAPEDVPNIGYLAEERGLFKSMKVGEQALYSARLKGLSRAEATARLKRWFIKFGIESWWNKKVSELSKGMAQKVQFIVTVLHEPELLIFDEPFSGFDPINANLLKQEILELKDKGATVIFSTHNMSSVEEVCDHITLINKSKNILSGSLDEIRRSHGGNIFEVDFRGPSDPLREALLNAPCSLLDGSASDDEALENQHSSSLKIHIPKDEDIQSIISLINDTTSLRSFREVIPSMNDIFIRAVAGEL
jgi:ABC-2 type transport system ATP-binding protein